MDRGMDLEESAAFLGHDKSHTDRDQTSSPKSSETDTVDTHATQKSTPTTRLQRGFFIIVLVLIYTICAVFSWTVLCILSVHPIGRSSYDLNVFTDVYYGSEIFHGQFSRSVRYFRAARVINAGVVALTIPLATAVCARAAVTYAQQRRNGFTIRQVIALADQGWANPEVLVKLFLPWQARRYGSLLLWLGLFIHILGLLIGPIQQLFLSQKTVKIPMQPNNLDDLTDFPDFWWMGDKDGSTSTTITQLRAALGTVSTTDSQTNLWFGTSTQCNASDGVRETLVLPQYCSEPAGAATWATATYVDSQPFVAQLPVGFNTGVIRQFAPRLNSTISYDTVDPSEFPSDCENLPGAYYVAYEGSSGLSDEAYSLQACMPMNETNLFWKPTRQRQDISEVLYLNISSTKYQPGHATVFRVQANSSAGYFELPNYFNGQIPGPLLETDPNELCDEHCYYQGPNIHHPDSNNTRRRRDDSDPYNNNATVVEPVGPVLLEAMYNKPPLLAVTVALFGEGSYISTRTRNMTLCEGTPDVVPGNMTAVVDHLQFCAELTPLYGLMSDSFGSTMPFLGPCVSNICLPGSNEPFDIEGEVANWLTMFWLPSQIMTQNVSHVPGYQMQLAFTSAVYLAHLHLLTKDLPTVGSLYVTYDLGADMEIPAISRTGIIVVSTLLGVFLLSIFIMVAYATHVPTWTTTLNGFAMMRIGAAMTEDKVPLMMSPHNNDDNVPVLDRTPGWVGDGSEEGQPVGKLALGAQRKLRGGKRKYECYRK